MYADGAVCSLGCRPLGARFGWPVAPFHAEHPLRSGLNELRPGSLHVGLDVQVRDGTRVYAVQPGLAHVLAARGPDARVQVGNYVYWHIAPTVRSGEYVVPFKTVLGRVMAGYGHFAFSELGFSGQYVNPLRPGGRVLDPLVDQDRPVIATPKVAADGEVVVGAYAPQSFVRHTTYITPVLAPSSLAYRLYSARGTPLTPLEWALRGTHLEPFALRRLIYAPGTHEPGFACFAKRRICVPRWNYRIAGGFAPSLPRTLGPGHYRLTIYAWDFDDHATALDTTVTLTARGWRPLGHFPPAVLDGSWSGAERYRYGYEYGYGYRYRYGYQHSLGSGLGAASAPLYRRR